MRSTRLLAALALVASLTACGSGGQEPDAAAQDSEEVAEDAAAVVAEEPAAETAPPAAGVQPQGQGEDPTLRRPAEIVVTITGREMYAGTYRAAGTSRTCGPMQTYVPGQENAWWVQFPFEGEFKVRDLSFTAENLPAGGTTDRFRLSLGLETEAGRQPPSFAVRPDGSDPDESGTATLTSEGGVDRLVVRGKTSSETFEMTVICQPRRG